MITVGEKAPEGALDVLLNRIENAIQEKLGSGPQPTVITLGRHETELLNANEKLIMRGGVTHIAVSFGSLRVLMVQDDSKLVVE